MVLSCYAVMLVLYGRLRLLVATYYSMEADFRLGIFGKPYFLTWILNKNRVKRHQPRAKAMPQSCNPWFPVSTRYRNR